MALLKEPDRLKPHCSWPPPRDAEADNVWLDYGAPPPDYDPPTVDPVQNPVRDDNGNPWWPRVVVFLCALALLAVLGLLWLIGIPTRIE